MIKIEAAKRLTSVRIIPQEEAYSDKDGRFDLNTYNPKRYGRKIKTNIEGFILAVRTDAPKITMFIEAFLLHEGVPVGFVSLTKMMVNGRNGMIYMPSSYFLPEYRKMGYAKAIYKWILLSGTNLITGTTQSQMSNNLWAALSKEFTTLIYENGAIKETPSPTTKFIMLGKGCTKTTLVREFRLADWTIYG